jgi:esterase
MKLHFKELGESNTQALIILHGFLGSLDNWLTHAKKLAEKYHVFIPDQRNHGRSPRSEVFTYQALADDLYDFVQENSISQPYVLGHSMGGKVAMQCSTDHPFFAKKLVIADMGIKGYPIHHDRILAGLAAIPLENLKDRQEAESILSQYEENAGTRQFLLKNLYRDDNQQFAWRINLPVMKNSIGRIVEALDIQQPDSTPTLFIRGEKSYYITDEDIPSIQAYFPNSQWVTVPNAGHWLHVDQPAIFLEEVLHFLKE